MTDRASHASPQRHGDDAARVREALRAGAQPVQILCKNPLTRRAAAPQTVVQGPDGDMLVLIAHSRVTPLGREWDRQRAERTAPQARSRSPRGKTASE